MKSQVTTLSILVLSIILAADAPATEALEAARKASMAASEALRSAQGNGTFTVHRRNLTDKDEELWTDGTFELSYDRGKHYLDLSFTKLLQRTRYTDANGQFTEKVVDWSPDRVVIVHDGQTACLVTFSERIRPTGCRVETFDSIESAAVSASFPLRKPAQPWLEVLDVDALLKNIEADAITLSALENGRVRGTYDIKNSKQVYADFEVDPQSGYNVVATRTFNRPSLEPAATHRLSWAKADAVWYVKQYEASNTYRPKDDPPLLHRVVVAFGSFTPNKPIDEKVFKIESIPIPPRTRTLDRRAAR